jgi:hypothetical protein
MLFREEKGDTTIRWMAARHPDGYTLTETSSS